MTKLSQLIERNRRHSESPYILLLEAALPSGVTLYPCRDEDTAWRAANYMNRCNRYLTRQVSCTIGWKALGDHIRRGSVVQFAVDQLLNTLLGGWPDETLSSRCYRWARDGVRAWPRKLVDGLFFWQREHCKSSYESEKEGRQSPPELRRSCARLV